MKNLTRLIKPMCMLGLIPVASSNVAAKSTKSQIQKPNILCIVCEDISPYLGCYGDKVAKSPNIDRLASESVRYDRMFTPLGVSAPSRCALITGMYPSRLGGHNMRVLNKASKPEGLEPYEIVLPSPIKAYPEFMRAAGYYCTNNAKEDHQFNPPLTTWDEKGKEAHWKNRPADMPFFSIFNLEVTHESRLWTRENEPLVVNPKDVVLPPYYPDTELSRKAMATMYGNIYEMDRQVQELIDQIKAAGLLENTIIIFYSDNGGPLPRQKREIYESGMLVPFMIRYPDGYGAGTSTDRLCSFIDIPATILSLAGVKPPKYMQGRPFAGEYNAEAHQYVFGARNRLDAFFDKQGCVRDSRFRYVKNYAPEKCGYIDVKFRLSLPMMREMKELYAQGKLNDVQKRWFEPRLAEEFYDVEADPHEINNLINDPKYAADIARLRKEYRKWDAENNALFHTDEFAFRNMMWKDGMQPQAEEPIITIKNNRAVITSPTENSSVAYQINNMGHSADNWLLYTAEITLKKGDVITAIADRSGYRQSEKVSATNN